MPMAVPRIIGPARNPHCRRICRLVAQAHCEAHFVEQEDSPDPQRRWVLHLWGPAKSLSPTQLRNYAQRMASRNLHACLLTPLRAACNWSRSDHWRTDMPTSQRVTSTVPRAGSRGSLAAKVTRRCRVRPCTAPRRRRLSGAQATWAPGHSQFRCSG